MCKLIPQILNLMCGSISTNHRRLFFSPIKHSRFFVVATFKVNKDVAKVGNVMTRVTFSQPRLTLFVLVQVTV